MQEFIAFKTNVKINRTYGGSTYTLEIYQNKGVGKFVRVASRKACTRAHAGEISEAYQELIATQSISKSAMKLIRLAEAAKTTIGSSYLSYYNYTYPEKFGVKISVIE